MIDFWISTLHIECTTKGWQTAIIAADLQLKKLLQFGFILTPFSSFIFDIVFICKLLVSIFQNDKLQSLLQTCFETYGLTFNFNLETLFLFTRQAYYFSANYWFLVFSKWLFTCSARVPETSSPRSLTTTFSMGPVYFWPVFGVFNCWN